MPKKNSHKSGSSKKEKQDSDFSTRKNYILENQFKEKEWVEFYESNSELMDTEKSESIFKNIELRIRRDRNRTRLKLYVGSSIAAILILFFGIQFFITNLHPLQNYTSNVLIEKLNNTDKPIEILFGEADRVTLYPNSEIKYDSAASSVYLSGKAKFKIKHKDNRTFKVYCGDLVTVDKGTVFLVEEIGNDIRVELFEGEVFVHKLKEETSGLSLLPGEYLVYKAADRKLAKLTNSAKDNVLTKNETHKAIKNNNKEDSSILKFRNKNLSTILDELAADYDIKINYPTVLAKNIRMNMVIDTTQKIEVILKNISAVSNLELKINSETEYSFTDKPKNVTSTEKKF